MEEETEELTEVVVVAEIMGLIDPEEVKQRHTQLHPTRLASLR